MIRSKTKKYLRPSPKGKKRKELNRQRGQALILTTVFIAALLILSASIVSRSANLSSAGRGVNQKIAARALAEAGVEKAIFCLNQKDGANCGGTFGTNYIGESNVSVGNGTFTTAITTVDSRTKSVSSTGYFPNDTRPFAQVTIKTQVMTDAEKVSFNYGVQTGIGGLQMGNTSKIIGNVYSNGSISGTNKPQITGDAYVAGGGPLAENQSNTDQRTDFIFGKVSTQEDVAQSFQINADQRAVKTAFYIKKVGSPSDVAVRILTDNGGAPGKTVLGNGTLQASQVTASYGWTEVALASPANLMASTTYWLSIDAAANSSKYWTISLDDQDGYSAGKAMVSPNWNAANPIWNDSGGDYNFKIWIGGVATSITNLTISNDARANTITDSAISRDAYANTISNSDITRDARAASVTDGAVGRDVYADNVSGTVVGGNRYPGVGEADPSMQNLPVSAGQIADWKTDASAGGVTEGSLNLKNLESQTLGPQKINGDVTLSNSASIKLTGPLWITGNLTLNNTTKLSVDPSFGSYGTAAIVDGAINIGNLAQVSGSGAAGSYLLAISLSSGIADNQEAIQLGNGTNTSIFYAPSGAIAIANSVALKEVSAYLIKLGQSATVTYDSGLASSYFSSGPGTSWVIKKGTWQEL